MGLAALDPPNGLQPLHPAENPCKTPRVTSQSAPASTGCRAGSWYPLLFLGRELRGGRGEPQHYWPRLGGAPVAIISIFWRTIFQFPGPGGVRGATGRGVRSGGASGKFLA